MILLGSNDTMATLFLILLNQYDTFNAVGMGAVLYSLMFSLGLEELKWDSKIQEKV